MSEREIELLKSQNHQLVEIVKYYSECRHGMIECSCTKRAAYALALMGVRR